MNNRISSAWWLALALACGSAIANDQIRWAPDVGTGRRASAQFNVPLLIHFYGDNCLPCQTLDQRVYSRPELVHTLNKYFICVRVNASSDRQTAADFNVHSWPTDVFVSPDGMTLFQDACKQELNAYLGVLHNVAVMNRDRNLMLVAHQQAQAGHAQAGQAQAGQAQAGQPQAGQAQAGQPQAGQAQAGQAQAGQAQAGQAQVMAPQAAGQGYPSGMLPPASASASFAAPAGASALGSNRAGPNAAVAGSVTPGFYNAAPQQNIGLSAEPQPVARALAPAGQQLQQSQSPAQGVFSGPLLASNQPQATTAATAMDHHMIAPPLQPPLAAAPTGQLPMRESSSLLPNATGPAAPHHALAAYASHPIAQVPATHQVPVADRPHIDGSVHRGGYPVASNAGLSRSGAVMVSNPYYPAPPAMASGVSQQVDSQPVDLTHDARQPTAAQQVSFQPRTPSTKLLNDSRQPLAAPSPLPAMEGYCVIRAKQGEWVPGKSELAVVHRGQVYWFSDASAQQQFLANPDKSAPVLAGCDPMLLLSEGRLVPGSIHHTLHERTTDRLYLFASDESKQQFYPSGDTSQFEKHTRALLTILRAAGVNQVQ